MKQSFSKWQRVKLDFLVSELSNVAFRHFCDSGFEVWRHKVKSDCYRVTLDGDVEHVILDDATLAEVVEFLEE